MDTKTLAIIGIMGALGIYAYTKIAEPKFDPDVDAELRRKYNIPPEAKMTFGKEGITYDWKGKKIDVSRSDIEKTAKAVGKGLQTIWGWFTKKGDKEKESKKSSFGPSFRPSPYSTFDPLAGAPRWMLKPIAQN